MERQLKVKFIGVPDFNKARSQYFQLLKEMQAAAVKSLRVQLQAQQQARSPRPQQQGNDTAEAQAQVEDLKQSINGFFANVGRGFAQKVGQVTLDAIAKASDFLKNSIGAAFEQERFLQGVDAQLASTGNAAGFTAKQLENLADQVGEATLGSEESTKRAIQELLVFDRVGGQVFERSIRISQDLAETRRRDITSVSTLVGQALQAPEQGLSRLERLAGRFTKTFKQEVAALVQSGDVEAAQNKILGELEARVGGTAERAAAGLQGVFDTIGERTNDLRRQVGAELGEIIAPLAEELLAGLGNFEVPPELAEISEKTKALVVDIIDSAKAIGEEFGPQLRSIGQASAELVVILIDGFRSLAKFAAAIAPYFEQTVNLIEGALTKAVQLVQILRAGSAALTGSLHDATDAFDAYQQQGNAAFRNSQDALQGLKQTYEELATATGEAGVAAEEAAQKGIEAAQNTIAENERLIAANRSLSGANPELSNAIEQEIRNYQRENEQLQEQIELNKQRIAQRGLAERQETAGTELIDFDKRKEEQEQLKKEQERQEKEATKAREDARKVSLQEIADAETEALIEVEKLYNKDRLSKEEVELVKAKAAKARADKEIAFAKNTQQATLKAVRAQRKVQEALEKVTLSRIARETKAQERAQQVTKQALERRLSLQQAAEKAIARRQRLLESEANLLRSQSSLQQTAFDIAAQLSDNENEQKRLQEQAASARVVALEQQQALQLRLFEIGEQQNESELKRLAIQNRIKQSELELQRIKAQGQLRAANEKGDTEAAKDLVLQLQQLAQVRAALREDADAIAIDFEQNRLTRDQRRQVKQNDLTDELLKARAREAEVLDDPKLRRQVEQQALSLARNRIGLPASSQRGIPIAQQTEGIQIPGINAGAIAQQLQAQQQAQAESVRQMAQVYITQQQAQAETLRQTLQVAQQEQAQAIRERLQLQQSAIAKQIEAGSAIVNLPAQSAEIPSQIVPRVPSFEPISRPANQSSSGVDKDVLVGAIKEAFKEVNLQQDVTIEQVSNFAVGANGKREQSIAEQVAEQQQEFFGEVIQALKPGK